MKKTLNDYLKALSPERREKVEKRATELIAEEMTLQELRKARQQSQQSLEEKLLLWPCRPITIYWTILLMI